MRDSTTLAPKSNHSTTTLAEPPATKCLRRQCPACGRGSWNCPSASAKPAQARYEWGVTTLAAPKKIIAQRPPSISEVPGNANSLQGEKPHIGGPVHVVGREVVAGRTWRTVVSADGMSCEVARLRPRVLCSNGGTR